MLPSITHISSKDIPQGPSVESSRSTFNDPALLTVVKRSPTPGFGYRNDPSDATSQPSNQEKKGQISVTYLIINHSLTDVLF